MNSHTTLAPTSTKPLLSEHDIPVMGLGTWQLTDKTVQTIEYALGLGYPLIDTSSDYGTHSGIAKALDDILLDRDKVYVVTKVEETDDAFEASKAYVDELGLTYADLILIHRPPKEGAGVDLWKGLIQAKEAGYTNDIGVSNYTIEQMEKLIKATGEIPVVNQIEWSPFGHSQEMLDYCKEKHIVIMAYSPLTRTKKLDNPMLQGIAQVHDKSPAQVLIRWNLQLGTVPIPKANQKHHLMQNIDVFDFELTQDEMSKLSDLNEHFSSLGGLPYI